MKRFFRHYPISLAVAIVIIYLSCFKPPHVEAEDIPGMDKVVHCGMYCFLSLLSWLEFMRTHHKDTLIIWWRGWLLGLVFPTVLGIAMEVIQKYCTNYRSFEWGDILADTAGAILGSIIAVGCIKLLRYRKAARNKR